MQSLWNESEAKEFKSDLKLRVYSSRVLGKSSDLVLHGGGNTSVKASVKNIFGENEEILYVKGSGWDLATIQEAGFAPVKMEMLLKLAALDTLSDTDMVNYQRSAMINPDAPNPSIEAILHAIIPFKFVDHTHADAVVALTNTPRSEARIKEVYGDSVIIIPYVMPGFVLAKEIARCIEGKDLSKIDGLILMHHGVFTFDDDARASYEKMIKLVTLAEEFNANAKKEFAINSAKEVDLLMVAQIREKINSLRSSPVIIKVDNSKLSQTFATSSDVERISTTGPLTPDHVIRTKKNGVVISSIDDIDEYVKNYKEYFSRHNDKNLTMLDPTPKWGVIKGSATISIGSNLSDANIIHDIKEHTMNSIVTAESIEKYVALSEKDIFDMEYWELEQAKLKKSKSALVFEGRVVLITEPMSELSKIVSEKFLSQGAVVAAIESDIEMSIKTAIMNFGGIDIVINTHADTNTLASRCEEYLQYGHRATFINLHEEIVDSIKNEKIRVKNISKNSAFDDANYLSKVVASVADGVFDHISHIEILG